jgi:hypothetical protein
MTVERNHTIVPGHDKVASAEFDTIFGRIWADGIPYGSGPTDRLGG